MIVQTIKEAPAIPSYPQREDTAVEDVSAASYTIAVAVVPMKLKMVDHFKIYVAYFFCLTFDHFTEV